MRIVLIDTVQLFCVFCVFLTTTDASGSRPGASITSCASWHGDPLLSSGRQDASAMVSEKYRSSHADGYKPAFDRLSGADGVPVRKLPGAATDGISPGQHNADAALRYSRHRSSGRRAGPVEVDHGLKIPGGKRSHSRYGRGTPPVQRRSHSGAWARLRYGHHALPPRLHRLRQRATPDAVACREETPMRTT
jgi:hypothetical protein